MFKIIEKSPVDLPHDRRRPGSIVNDEKIKELFLSDEQVFFDHLFLNFDYNISEEKKEEILNKINIDNVLDYCKRFRYIFKDNAGYLHPRSIIVISELIPDHSLIALMKNRDIHTTYKIVKYDEKEDKE